MKGEFFLRMLIYYRIIIEELAADGTAFDLMKVLHAKVTAGQERYYL